LGFSNVLELGLIVEGLFKYPTGIAKILSKLIDNPGWKRLIDQTMSKEDVNNQDLMVICINMVTSIGHDLQMHGMVQKFEQLFEKLASAKDEDLKPITLCTLLLTI
jgi:hypothetical protein